MTDDVRSIGREITRLRHGRARTAVRYPPALRQAITALARQRRAHRGGLTAVARELDLPRWTLNLWMRTPPAPRVRAVTVVPDVAPTAAALGPVLVMPNGIRLEGASLDALAALLRALR
ncbi:MAG TPA: hypothetical protein VNI83_11505 [Vicinamibacterales bacterium]|nr:hypothetical protein [Vicinamibacterales bacterium]